MTGLRAFLVLCAVVAGDYAALMLIVGQLTDSGIGAVIGAVALVGAGLIEYAVRRRRDVLALGNAAVWDGRDRQVANSAQRQCPSCAGAHQKPNESPRFVDRQSMLVCRTCTPAINGRPIR